MEWTSSDGKGERAEGAEEAWEPARGRVPYARRVASASLTSSATTASDPSRPAHTLLLSVSTQYIS